MSTDHAIFRSGCEEVVIVERSAKFDLDLDTLDAYVEGPQRMDADTTIQMAIGILYAVWCSHPDKVNEAIRSISNDKVPNVWNQIVKARTEVP
jgi:hypothetical protein